MHDARETAVSVWTFGPYRLDLTERALLCAGKPVPLRAKLFDTLAYLVARAGKLVERQELLDAIWPESIVEEGNLSHNVSALRKALGDGDDYIQTVPKRGYRFVHPVTAAGGGGGRDELGRARRAFAQGAWSEAHRLFGALAAATPLASADLARQADAARWAGRNEEVVPLLESTVEAFRREGDAAGAASTALDLATVLLDRGRPALARSYLRQAERSLDQAAAPRERGRYARLLGRFDWLQGAWAQAFELAQQALALARESGDRDTEALALVEAGHAMMAMQRFAEATPLLEEAGTTVTSGEIGPYAAGVTLCGLISGWRACGRLDRAAEWVEASIRWVDREGVTQFPGICRIHRGELACLRGDLAAAEADLVRGSEELAAADAVLAGMGLRELGLVRLRRGDLDGAEQAFGRALDFGFDPQPGLALLRAARGETELGCRDLERFLAEPDDGPRNILDRGNRYLTLGVLVALACSTGAIAVAQRAAAELETIAASGAPAHRATADAAAGEVALATGDLAEALLRLRRSAREWTALNAPHEAACVRAAIAEALCREGDVTRARMELEGAAATFARLGAPLDHQRALRRLDELSTDRPPAAVGVVACAEIVGEAGLRAAVGDAGFAELAAWLERRLLSCWQTHGGRPLQTSSGSYAVAFADLGSCQRCVGYVRRSLQEHRSAHGFAPVLRLGLIRADVVAGAGEGELLALAQRVVRLAAGGEVAIVGEAPVAAERRATVPDSKYEAGIVAAARFAAPPG